jgi:hypothetical protein
LSADSESRELKRMSIVGAKTRREPDMELRTMVGYLVALAVPLWLVGELMVHSWKRSNQRQSHLASHRLHAGPARRPSRAPAGRLAGSRKPA